MSIHKIRYHIQPSGACPGELQNSLGFPGTECEVDTDFVAACAMGEIIQTGPSSAPLAMMFADLLVSGGTKLVWKGPGPGRGIEMKRAFSGLFGRFFARAYLQRYHGFT